MIGATTRARRPSVDDDDRSAWGVPLRVYTPARQSFARLLAAVRRQYPGVGGAPAWCSRSLSIPMPRANPAGSGTAEDLSAPLNHTLNLEPAPAAPSLTAPSLAATRSQAAATAALRAPASLVAARTRSAPGGLEVAGAPPPIVQLSSRVSMSESVVTGNGLDDDDDDGCWARARKRNFVLLRGFLVLVLHFLIGVTGYLPFKDDFVQQHNATEGVVDALYFSAGECSFNIISTLRLCTAAELAEIPGHGIWCLQLL